MNPIDEILQEEWQQQGIQFSELCSDDAFLRRVSLDLIGRIPTVTELQEFRHQPNRSAKIEALLESPEFNRFQADLWTSVLVGYQEPFEEESSRVVLRDWLQEAFRNGRAWDDVARDLIASEGQSALDGPVNFILGNREEPVVRISRVFLGVRLDCARCHDHPFDRWTQNDFVLMNRFFDVLDIDEVSEGNVRLRNVVRSTSDEDRPRFLTGARPHTSRWRDEFALFATRSRPFARAFANRLWYQLFGRGIVHPVDDFNPMNDPMSRRLLEHLAAEARRTRFNVRALLKDICESRAWQASSKHRDASESEVASFAIRTIRPLTPEQVSNSLQVVLQREMDADERQELIESMASNGDGEDFSSTWDYHEDVQQVIARLSSTTGTVAGSTEELFDRILSRRPTHGEKRLCHDRPRSEILFALIHSDEFRFNH